MDVKGKLEVIAHLGDHISYKEDIGICYDSDLAKVIEDAYMSLKNGVTVQDWISVKDRLPEECGFYICFFQSPYGNGCWRVGQCHWNEESWVRIGAVPPHVIVTHWMPLPQPPKGE